MLSSFTLGQYYNTTSVIHRLDPRFKLLQLIFIIAFIFVCKNFFALFLMCALVLIAMLLSKVPFRMYLRNLKVILPIVVFTAILNMLYVNQGEVVLFSWWIITVTLDGVLKAAFMVIRILLLILISAVLTYTTTPTELTDAIESLFKPLKFLGLGELVHTLAMMMTIALRFIPTLTDETDKIISAQKARGADLESGNILSKIKALLPILIPLLFSAIRRADDLADAMDCRCYSGGKGRTRMKKLVPGVKDYITTTILIVVFAAVIVVGKVF